MYLLSEQTWIVATIMGFEKNPGLLPYITVNLGSLISELWLSKIMGSFINSWVIYNIQGYLLSKKP